VKVLFAGGGTGGHLYPALAIARALVRLQPAARPFFVGARRGIERDVLPGTGFPHALLDLHPLYRTRLWRNWLTVQGAAGAWRALGALAREEPPRLVVGTGGYASGLVLAYAAAHGIPQVQQVADSHPGLTARWASRWSREIYLGFPEAESLLSHRRATFVETGNPIEPPPAPRPDRAAARQAWGFPRSGGRVLLIVGGSQGARAINAVVAPWLESAARPEDLFVIWATGRQEYDVYARLDGAGVRVRPYLSPIADAYAATDLALARAGAMTTAELCAWGIPMVLVPLPTAAADHQTANARALARAGAAEHLPQAELTPERLATVLSTLAADSGRLGALARAAALRGRPDAADVIAGRILALVKETAPPA
jgi:UDP-N-acetylglucosamine--N-acetylmuramyl-(pentapeptide) pyrophosphoryl-undecaprenol N-acetylglucosamine transferase